MDGADEEVLYDKNCDILDLWLWNCRVVTEWRCILVLRGLPSSVQID